VVQSTCVAVGDDASGGAMPAVVASLDGDGV
jgi:hypothetical protein